jgi:hypothetical protein
MSFKYDLMVARRLGWKRISLDVLQGAIAAVIFSGFAFGVAYIFATAICSVQGCV